MQHETLQTIATWCEQNWPRYSDAELAQHAVAALRDLQYRVEGRGAVDLQPRREAVVASLGDLLVSVAHLAFRRRMWLPANLTDGLRGVLGPHPRTINLSAVLGATIRHLVALEGCLGQGALLDPLAFRFSWASILAALEYLGADPQAAIDQAMARRRATHGAPAGSGIEAASAILLIAAARPLLDEVRLQVDAWARTGRGPGRTQRGLPQRIHGTAGAMFDTADALARYDEARAESSIPKEASQ